jgi:hypothetical protein
MARSYARIMTAIWRDVDFLALTERAQRVFLLLVTQPDISAAGTLPLRARRWASYAKDSTGASLAEGLKELEQQRFIVADKTTEELLVRSFVKWDGGSGNRKRVPVILAAAVDVTSDVIRKALRIEFEKVGLPTALLTDAVSDSASDAVSDRASVVNLAEVREERQEALLSQVDALSDGIADAVTLSDRVVVGYVSSSGTATHNPQPVPPPAAPDGAQAIVGEWIEHCRKRPPGRVIGQIAKQVKSMLDEDISPDDVRAGLAEWAGKADLHPSTLPSLVNGVMNRTARLPVAKPSTTDARVAAAQALKAHFAADPQPFALPTGGVS